MFYKSKEEYKEKAREYQKLDYVKEKNRESVKKYTKSEKGRRKIRERERKRYKTDANYKLRRNFFRSVRKSLKENNLIKECRTADFLGYSLLQLENRLRTTIPDGRFWQDFLDGKLHIDHIIPKSYFDLTIKENLIKCWSLENLRLCDAYENTVTKNGKLDLNLIKE